jgi:hypothetical protein
VAVCRLLWSPLCVLCSDLDQRRDGESRVAPVEAKLLPAIDQGSFFMLYGQRGGGKSTRVLYAQRQLVERGYMPLYVSMDTAIDFRSEDAFWATFGKELELRNRLRVQLPIINNASAFRALFSSKANFGGRKPVLLLDEFGQFVCAVLACSFFLLTSPWLASFFPPDNVYRTAAQSSVLGTLRGMKHQPDTHCLQV